MKLFQKILSFFLILQFLTVPIFAQDYGQALGGRTTGKFQQKLQTTPQPTFGVNPQYNSFGADPSQVQAGVPQTFMQQPQMGLDALGYQIHILGQVMQPGTYRLPPSTRLAEAIRSAGGVLNTGSQRQVELRRKSGVERYDLLGFQLKGDLKDNPFLLDNDVIFVPFSEKNVQVVGPVKHPGTFELTSANNHLCDALELAGGFTPGVSIQEPIKIVRYADGKKQVLDVVNAGLELQNFNLQNGDIVIVPHVLGQGREYDYNVASLPADNVFYPSYNDNIYVLGAVAVPGAFSFNPHFVVQDFLSMAGVQKTASKHGVYILKADGVKVRRVMSKKNYLLSPGDTIVVPERAFRSDNVIKWYSTITTSIISGFTVYKLANQ